jgi:integrase
LFGVLQICSAIFYIFTLERVPLMATIIPRLARKGKKTWQAQVRKKGYPKKTKTFDRKTDAVNWARKIERQMDEQTWRNVMGADTLLLKDALKRYLEQVSTKKRPASSNRDTLSATYLEAELGAFTLTAVTPKNLATYRDKRLKSASAHSVRLELALISHLYNVALREWDLGEFENPLRHVKRPQIPEGRCPILSESQVSRLIEECKKSRTPYLYPFVLLALHTGCRSRELRGLRWSQVNLSDGHINITGAEAKTHRARIIPLTPTAIELLGNIYGSRDHSDFVFPTRGKSKEPRDMHMAFNRAVMRAGLADLPNAGKLRIHDLRHICGSYRRNWP